MALNKTSLSEVYRKRARRYDLSANLYYLLGFREFAYRKRAINALNLHEGDCVVEIGCGTGLNFSLLREKVGPQGRIIGVDLTAEMLEEADMRIKYHNWSNVTLVQSDAAMFQFPSKLDGIISSFAITLIPEYDQIIQNGVAALSHDKRFAILDFRKPDNWPAWLIKFFVFLTRPFGVSLDLAERHPWESVNRYAATVIFQKFYFGLVYLCVGQTSKTS